MNNSNTGVSRCKGCGRVLTESQINRMNTQKDATKWVKEGYHSFVCYKQHHINSGTEPQSRSADNNSNIETTPQSHLPNTIVPDETAREKTTKESAAADSQITENKEVIKANISFGLGWIFGVMPFIGLIYIFIYMAKGFRRMTFQAFAVPTINVLAIVFLIFVTVTTEANPAGYLFLFWSIALGLPILSTLVLREMDWPKESEKEARFVGKPAVKIPMNKLENPNVAINKRAFGAESKMYIGRIMSIDLRDKTCLIKTDIDKEVTKSLSEIYVSDS